MTYEPQNLQRWTMPSHYFGAEWPEYFRAGFGQSRDSDALERSNFRSALRALGGESETVLVVRESHWAVGWVEWIAIHETDARALEIADELVAAVQDYLVVDEDDFSTLEWEEAADYWDSLTPRQRVEIAKDARSSMWWHANTPVWHYGRLDYCALVNRDDEISRNIEELVRQI